MRICCFFVFFFFTQFGVWADHHLTFIIPCYNSEKWIEDALQSIYQQKLNCPFEVICTDDGSTDSTYALLCTLQKKYPELCVLQHAHNRGGGAARNTCVRHSQGDIIFCLDSDNILYPNSVQPLIDRMDATSADVVSFGGIQYFTNDLQMHSAFTYSIPADGYSLRDILQDANTPPWSGNYLYTRQSFDLVGGYPELTIDTFGFGFKQSLHGCKMVFIPNTFYLHRIDIDGYFSRETKTGRLPVEFFDLLLSHRNILTNHTIRLLQSNRALALKGLPYTNPIFLMEDKVIQLR